MSSVEKEVVEVNGKRLEVEIWFYECQGLFEARYKDFIGVGTTREKAIQGLIEMMKEEGVI